MVHTLEESTPLAAMKEEAKERKNSPLRSMFSHQVTPAS